MNFGILFKFRFTTRPFGSGVRTKNPHQKNRKNSPGFLRYEIVKGGLLFGEELGDDGLDFFFAISVAFDRIDELTALVLGDDTMALELGLFDFFFALASSDEDVLEGDFFSLCLFEIIHDDRNFCTKRSSVEIIIGEHRNLGLGGSFRHRSLGLVCGSSIH